MFEHLYEDRTDPMYSATAWRRLIQLFAAGREQCNCGDAYWEKYPDGGPDSGRRCPAGCDANRSITRDRIAYQIEQLFKLPKVAEILQTPEAQAIINQKPERRT